MTQSHQHGDPKLEGESHDDYDVRTWRSKLNTEERNGEMTIVIPAHGVQQCITAGAQYSKRKIEGKGAATWAKKFTSGIMLTECPSLGIDPAMIRSITISANADGRRGSGTRVPRRFPIIPIGWSTTFDVVILDPIITQQIFREMVELAGMFIGLGQFRPEKGGTNGRFRIEQLQWSDNRRLAA
jgi:hypothetical protein